MDIRNSVSSITYDNAINIKPEEKIKLMNSPELLSETAVHDVLRTIDKDKSSTKLIGESLNNKTAKMTDKIRSIVSSIPYQDINRQRIERVVDSLNVSRRDLAELSEVMNRQGGRLDTSDLSDLNSHLQGMYTMESERKLLKHHRSSTDLPSGSRCRNISYNDDNVELF